MFGYHPTDSPKMTISEIEEKIKAQLKEFEDAEDNNKKKVSFDSTGTDEFDDMHARALANLIKSEKYCFYSIYIFREPLTDVGIQAITAALKGNSTLVQLSLQWNNNMTDKGLKAIADLLPTNPVLDTVYIEKHWKITVAGAEYLAEKFVERNKLNNIKKLDLPFAEALPDEVIKAFDKKVNELSPVVINQENRKGPNIP